MEPLARLAGFAVTISDAAAAASRQHAAIAWTHAMALFIAAAEGSGVSVAAL